MKAPLLLGAQQGVGLTHIRLVFLKALSGASPLPGPPSLLSPACPWGGAFSGGASSGAVTGGWWGGGHLQVPVWFLGVWFGNDGAHSQQGMS